MVEEIVGEDFEAEIKVSLKEDAFPISKLVTNPIGVQTRQVVVETIKEVIAGSN